MAYNSVKTLLCLSLLSILVGCNPDTNFSAKNPQYLAANGNSNVLDASENVGEEQDAGENENTVENTEEVADAQEHVLKACKVDVRFTSIGNNARITVISGPMDKIVNDFSKDEFQRLAIEDREFLKNALKDNLQNIAAQPGYQATIQNKSAEIIVKNSDLASAYFNQVNPDVRLAFQVEGKIASVRGTTLKANSRVIAVLKGSESASLSFTSIHDNAEIFIFAPTSSENTTCVSATGIVNSVQISSYVYSDGIAMAQGYVRATGVKSDGQLNHHVIGGDNSLAVFEATSIEKLNAKLLIQGGNNTHSSLKFTSLHDDNNFQVKMIGKDNTSLKLKGTSAGHGSVLDLDLKGNRNVSADVKFTAYFDFLSKGKITAKENPSFNSGAVSDVLLVTEP